MNVCYLFLGLMSKKTSSAIKVSEVNICAPKLRFGNMCNQDMGCPVIRTNQIIFEKTIYDFSIGLVI